MYVCVYVMFAMLSALAVSMQLCVTSICVLCTQVDALSAFGGVLSIIPYTVIPLNTSNCGPTQGSFSLKKKVAKTSNHPSCSSCSPSH